MAVARSQPRRNLPPVRKPHLVHAAFACPAKQLQSGMLKRARLRLHAIPPWPPLAKGGNGGVSDPFELRRQPAVALPIKMLVVKRFFLGDARAGHDEQAAAIREEAIERIDLGRIQARHIGQHDHRGLFGIGLLERGVRHRSLRRQRPLQEETAALGRKLFVAIDQKNRQLLHDINDCVLFVVRRQHIGERIGFDDQRYGVFPFFLELMLERQRNLPLLQLGLVRQRYPAPACHR